MSASAVMVLGIFLLTSRIKDVELDVGIIDGRNVR